MLQLYLDLLLGSAFPIKYCREGKIREREKIQHDKWREREKRVCVRSRTHARKKGTHKLDKKDTTQRTGEKQGVLPL